MGKVNLWDGDRWVGVDLINRINPETKERRIVFDFPYNPQLQGEIKTCCDRGKSKSHFNVFKRKKWSAPDTARTRYFIDQAQDGPHSSRYYEDIVDKVGDNGGPSRAHQIELINAWLNRKGVIGAYEMGTGKTLCGIKGMELIHDAAPSPEGVPHDDRFWIIAPKKLLDNWRQEFKKWGSPIKPRLIVNSMQSIAKAMEQAVIAPQALIIDESSHFRRDSERTKLAVQLTSRMYRFWKLEAYVLLLTGNPAPLSYLDWFWQCEIACPGFIREGNPWFYRNRLAVFESREGTFGGNFSTFVTWRNGKCIECELPRDDHGEVANGSFLDALKAAVAANNDGEQAPSLKDCAFYSKTICWECRRVHRPMHKCLTYKPQFTDNVDEIGFLAERLSPMVFVKKMDECADLPPIIYQVRRIPPSKEMIEAAEMIIDQCESKLQVLQRLRQFSDGFQYIHPAYGEEDFNPSIKGYETFENNLKVDLLRQVIEELSASAKSRVICFAAYKASVDICSQTFADCGWGVIQNDGRGWKGHKLKEHQECSDEYFREGIQDPREPLAFVSNPLSGGMGFNLQSSDTIIIFSNSFKSEYRSQLEARNRRIDSKQGSFHVIDLAVLGTDIMVLEAVKNKIDVEKRTLKEIQIALEKL